MTFGFALMAIGSILMLSGYENKTIAQVLSGLRIKPEAGETAFSAYLKGGGSAINAAFTGSGVEPETLPAPSGGSSLPNVKGKLNLNGHPRCCGSVCLHSGIEKIAILVLEKFPGLVITSTCDGSSHTSTSYHYKGRAVDIGGSTSEMHAAAEWIAQNMTPLLTEGIHNPNLSVKYHAPVPSSYWGASTWAGHADHIHLAV